MRWLWSRAEELGAGVVGGALYGAAFTWPWLGLVAWLPFVYGTAGRAPGRALLSALTYCAAGQLALGAWLPGTLVAYFEISPVTAWLAFAAIWLFVVSPPYLLAGWTLSGPSRVPLALRAGVALALGELLRLAVPWSGPYGTFAVAQVDLPFTQVASLVGPFAVAGLVAAQAGALFGLLRPSLAGPAPRAMAACSFLVLALATGYGVHRVSNEAPVSRAIEVGLVQPATRALPVDGAERRAHLDLHLAMSSEAVRRGSDVVFWPEYAVDIYPREPSEIQDALLRGARDVGAEVVLGAPHYRRGRDGLDYHTSVFLLREGELAGRYDKRALIPFAEFAPLGSWLRGSDARYTGGTGPTLLASETAAIGAFVCWEAMFPSLVGSLVREGATLLANPSNDDWFGRPVAAEHQLATARLRAIENRRFLVRSTRSGYSAAIDPVGRVLARSGMGEPELVRAAVEPRHEVTPYARWGDGPLWALCLLAVAWNHAPRSRTPRQGEPR